MSFITGALGFVLGLGLLIAFHEFGHYYIARLANVKILRFSIGFGKPLFRWVKGEDKTEYVIAMVPLGGYVSMLGQDEKDLTQTEADKDRAFCRQPLGIRTLIVAAGPVANFLLAAILFTVTYMFGSYEVRPVIGEVRVGSIAAQAGLRADDEFVRIGDATVTGWKSVSHAFVREILDKSTAQVEVLRDRNPQTFELAFGDTESLLNQNSSVLSNIGIKPARYLVPAVIGHLEPTGSAYGSGLQELDKIVFADGQAIDSWQSFVDLIRLRPNEAIGLTVERDGQPVDLRLQIGAIVEGDQQIGRIGAAPDVSEDTLRAYARFVNYPVLQAVAKGLTETVKMTWMTLLYIARMVTGELSLQNLSGPVTIAEVTGKTFNMGLVAYLTTLAILSISIGILNLLPIPMLDGGHLLYYLIEFIKRSPVTHSVQVIGYAVGLSMIGSLLLLALYNDLVRLLY